MSCGEHDFDFTPMHTCNVCKEQIDIEIISKYCIEQKLDLIELLHRNGYLAWGKEEIAREIKENCRMVRVLGGQYSYLREWIKIGLENVSHGRRVWDGDTKSG